jgi:hypothetical protein
MRFLSVLAAGAYLAEHVHASPIVEVTSRMVERDLVSRAVFTYQGCYSEGTSGGIGAGKALVGKTVAAPSGGMTVEFCAQSCAGFVLFGLETTTVSLKAVAGHLITDNYYSVIVVIDLKQACFQSLLLRRRLVIPNVWEILSRFAEHTKS